MHRTNRFYTKLKQLLHNSYVVEVLLSVMYLSYKTHTAFRSLKIVHKNKPKFKTLCELHMDMKD